MPWVSFSLDFPPRFPLLALHLVFFFLFFLGPYSLQANEEIQRAIADFFNSLLLLYSAPRIQEPLWLNMVTFPQRRPFIGKIL